MDRSGAGSTTWLSRLLAVGLALAGVVVLTGSPPASAASFRDVPATVQAAFADAASRNTTVAISYLDRQTGEYRDNGGLAHARFGSASLVKLFIADDVVYRAWRGETRLTDYDWQQLSIMLRSSDDAAASRLWSLHGGPAIIDRIKARYGLAEIGRPPSPTWWGLTQVTAYDLTLYYDRMLSGAGGLPQFLVDWELGQLRLSTPRGTDGFYQRMGIPDGLPAEGVHGVKQGWMCCNDGIRTIHSTGVVGADARYVVIVLAQEGSRTGYGHTTESVTRVVQRLFPTGRIPRPGDQNPVGSLDVARVDAAAMRLEVQGWAIDPDTTAGVVTHLYVDSGGFVLGPAVQPRPDLLSYFPAAGPAHGFSASVPVPGGDHRVCSYALNQADGDQNPLLGCWTVSAPQRPFGRLDAVTAGPGVVRVVGWVAEAELGQNPSPAHLVVDGVATDLGFVRGSRPDLRLGYAAYGTSHGFDVTVPVTAGTHEVCVRGVDLGLALGDTLLGCAIVTVS